MKINDKRYIHMNTLFGGELKVGSITYFEKRHFLSHPCMLPMNLKERREI
jgi:hypothetical protein